MSATQVSSTGVRRPPRKVYIAEAMFVVMLFGGFLVPWGIWFWFHFAPNVVLSTADLGRFVSASKGNGATNVETTKGTVAIDGTLSALRGSELVVQTSTKTGTELCVAGNQQSCVALSSPWSGPMQVVPGAEHATNFFAHGISSSILTLWRMLGFLVTLGTLMAASLEIVNNHPELKRG
ncbi:MAG: hypothetical protein EPN36_02840 [Rhodanobacteraceae bacterium]|nr:MAG: hypothetical protein EPN36_02840 [Rhodanobacteraceae bacterium]